MDTLFNHIYHGAEEMTPSEVKIWLGSMQDSRKTGVLGIHAHSDDKTTILLYQGNRLYTHPETSEVNGLGTISDPFPGEKDVLAKFIPLSAYGVIHSNLLMHVEASQKERWSGLFETSDLLSKPVGRADPYLLRLDWGGVSGSILFNSVSDEPHSLIAARKTLIEQSGVAEEILRLKDDPSCIVTVYSFDPSLDAWLELKLRRSFKQFCDQLLERFEHLTGRIITESFGHLMEANVTENKMNFTISKRRLVNQEFYPSTWEASKAYKHIILETLEHFAAVIGPRLLASNLREVFSKLPNEYQNIIRTFDIIPEGYI